MKSSPLAPALSLAADHGTADVIALVSRRHKPVRGTHLPCAADVRAALFARAVAEMVDDRGAAGLLTGGAATRVRSRAAGLWAEGGR